MKSLKIILATLLVWMQMGLVVSYGQTPVGIGQWRVHYPYLGSQNVAVANDKVYCSNTTSVFYYDQSDHSIGTISKKDGLSGVQISQLGSYRSQELLVGYSDGNIDFVKGNAITQFDDIQRSTIVGSLQINHFQSIGDNVFVCTDYGLSILDMTRREVSDSYINVSSDGTANVFYASVLSHDQDSIFVASAKGLLGAPFSPGVNLRDYSNWKLYGAADGLPTGVVKTVGRLGDVIFAGVNNQGIYYFDGTQWHASGIAGSDIRNITMGETTIGASVDGAVYKINSISSHQALVTSYFYNPYSAVFDAAGNLWFVQPSYGLAYYAPGSTTVSQIGGPTGPFTQDVYRLKYIDSKVSNFRGGLNASYGNIYKEAGVMYLGPDDVWKSYTIFSGLPSAARDLLDGGLQTTTRNWYFSTFGFGLIKWNTSTNVFSTLDTLNSPLQRMFLTGIATEADGTVWICNHAQVNASANKAFLQAIDPNGTTWYSFKPTQTSGKYPMEIVVDQLSNKWIRIDASGGIRGLLMFKEINRSAGTSTQIYFGVEENAGALPNLNVNAIDVDKTGQIWIGTDQGIAVFTNPSLIMYGNIPKAYLPIVDGFPLFFDKKINCIKTDGANRKWVGTPDGVFLLSADGLETIHKFNTTNSPMIDNNVGTITINEKTGEVFFGTDQGIISYRGDATTGEETHNDVKIFPNPVERDFDGWVGISGLANNARVKITDIAGKLTFETPANGGTASWNLKDYTGRRATAGVYLIFSATDDGLQKYVGKIAVLD